MNKKNMKTAFLSFLVACAGVYAAYASHDDDPRAMEFAKYISDDINAMVARHLTADEIQQYVESYRKDPDSFDLWIKILTDKSKFYNRELIKDATAIHELDSVAGRKLAFGEALHRIQELADTLPNPSDAVMLQRLINAKKDTDKNIALSRAAKEKIAAEK